MNHHSYSTAKVLFSAVLVLLVADALFPLCAGTLETVKRNFTKKMESIHAVHIEYVSIDTASLDDWQDILVRVIDYNTKEKSGREVFTFLSEPSITVACFQSDGVNSIIRPCRQFLLPSLSAKRDILFEEMSKRYENERWLNLEEITQLNFLPLVTNAFAAVTKDAPENCVIVKFTNQIVSVNIVYDWRRDVILNLTSVLTNGATIEYTYDAFKDTPLGVFPYVMRYGTPGRAFHTREFRITKFDFPTTWSKDILQFDIPHGTTVDDSRFNPPLTYQQGKHQYNDEELIQIAADRKAGKVVKVGLAAEAPIPADPKKLKQSPVLRYVLLALIVLSPVGFFILRGRRE